MQDEYWPLAEAVALALVHGGIEVMDNPGRLLAYIADLMDPECYEISVLMLLRRCNDRLVGPYRRAIGGGQGALRDAEARARDYLEQECVIDSGAAAAIAQGFAKGVARFQGALPSFQIRAQKWTDPQPWPTTPSRSRGKRGDGPGMRLDDDRTLAVTPDSQGDKATPRATNISGATFGPIAPQGYTGKPLQPDPPVSLGSARLVSSRDYLLSYSGNVGSPEHVTVATVTATGIGAYSGSASTTFRILPVEQPKPARGKDIHVNLDITESEASRGVFGQVEYEVPSTGRRASCGVPVPAGSADGDLVRVPRMGDFGPAGSRRGDLVVRLRVVKAQGEGGAIAARGKDEIPPFLLTVENPLTLGGGPSDWRRGW